MKTDYLLILLLFTIAFTSCSENTEKTEQQNNTPVEYEDLSEMMESYEEESVQESGDWHDYFEMNVPEHMREMTELNADAIAQFGYVEEFNLPKGETEVKEHYLIVMMESKADIEGYPVDLKVDALSYSHDAIESLRHGENVLKFIVSPDTSIIEQVNGMDCVRNEIVASLGSRNGSVELFYKLGIFEGEEAFYQVLSWCIQSQKTDFEKDMDAVIGSFSEK